MSMKKTPALLLILLAALTAAPASPAFAQAYRSQLHFLEEFAIRQYERGDIENARKQFGWILRIEPENAIAREYLEKISGQAAGTSTPGPEPRQQVITDISKVKTDLAEYERDARELERLIRELIHENDALYQVLYKRSREVAELRQKFYGTPYEQAYLQAMESLPIDRVPQRLHRSDDILPENGATMSQAEEQEINTILKDIAALSEQQQGGVDQKKLDAALQAKRDMLIQKTRALAEKRDSLNRLKNELTSINAGLKSSDSRYLEATQKIDAYYSRLKEKIAKKNYVEQKMFSELVSDYASKVKEIEELKKSVRTQDNALTSFKPDIESANNRLRDINGEMRSKDAELARFKNLINGYKQQLNERDTTLKQRNEDIRRHETVIQQQQNGLSMTDRKLGDVSREVTAIEEELKASDARIAQLKANIARVKKPAPGMLPDPALKEEISLLKNVIVQAQQDITLANENISRMAAREQAWMVQKQNLDEEISELRKGLKIRDARLAQIAPQAPQRTAPTETPDRLKAAEAELATALSLTAELKGQLAKRDAEIGKLNALPPKEMGADKKVLLDAIVVKNQELAAMKARLEQLQQTHDRMVKDLAQPSTDALLADELRQLTLNLKDKDTTIHDLQEELAFVKDTLKAVEMKYDARAIKQDAIDEVINDREVKIAMLLTQVEALKEELAAERSAQKENTARMNAADSAKALAENQLRSREEELSRFRDQVNNLVTNIRSAKAMVEQKSRDHDATLKELRRLNDILDQKKEELKALQRRVDGSVKKAPVPAPQEVKAPDCFKDCTPAVK